MNTPVSSVPARVLVADDNADVVEALRLLLKAEGYSVVSATSPLGVLTALEKQEFDVVLIDMNYARDTTSGREGMELLSGIAAQDSTLPVVVMTAWGTIQGAVEAIQHGARDYVEKPWSNERLLATLNTNVELSRALRQSRRLTGESSRQSEERSGGFLAQSRAMQPVLRLMERVAPSDANILVLGEHGTGKEIVARWLHAASPRAARTFVPVHCGAVPEGMFESELFGHVKGAFTDAKSDRIGCFELADGGTLFLDEIGTMPITQQAKLLRVLQTGEFQPVGSSRLRRVDVRIISATNIDINAEVARGAFREDLLYRLNTVEIQLPPLRERREDVPLLANHVLFQKAARYGKQLAFSPEAMQALLGHSWPGNIRELEHVVERAVLMAEPPRVEVQDVVVRSPSEDDRQLDRMTLAEAEVLLIRRALSRCGGNVTLAAEQLGLSRSAMYRRLQALGIKVQG